MKTRFILSIILITTSIAGLFAQIPSYVPTNNLVGWWPFNNSPNNLSSTSNHFTNYGMTYTTDRFNSPNAAVEGNGSSQYMIINSPSFIVGSSSSFTVSFWMQKTTQTYGVSVMHGTTTAGNFVWNFQTGATGALQFGTNKQQSAWIWTASTFSLNNWEHYVAVYNNGLITLYKNGVQVATNTFTHTGATQTTLPLYLGRGVAGAYQNGKIDDLGIWTRALTTQEITNLFTGGCQPTTASFNASACDSYLWTVNNQSFTASGVYTDTLINASGCDSIITLNLSISNLDILTQPADTHITINKNAQFSTASSALSANYQWQSNKTGTFENLADSGIFSGSQTPVLTLTQVDLAMHQVMFRCLINNDTCYDTTQVATLTVIDDTGLEDGLLSKQIKIYPNPASDYVVLQVNENLIGEIYYIYDAQGKIITQNKIERLQTRINTEYLSKGLYFIVLNEKTKTSFSKK